MNNEEEESQVGNATLLSSISQNEIVNELVARARLSNCSLDENIFYQSSNEEAVQGSVMDSQRNSFARFSTVSDVFANELSSFLLRMSITRNSESTEETFSFSNPDFVPPFILDESSVDADNSSDDAILKDETILSFLRDTFSKRDSYATYESEDEEDEIEFRNETPKDRSLQTGCDLNRPAIVSISYSSELRQSESLNMDNLSYYDLVMDALRNSTSGESARENLASLPPLPSKTISALQSLRASNSKYDEVMLALKDCRQAKRDHNYTDDNTASKDSKRDHHLSKLNSLSNYADNYRGNHSNASTEYVTKVLSIVNPNIPRESSLHKSCDNRGSDIYLGFVENMRNLEKGNGIRTDSVTWTDERTSLKMSHANSFRVTTNSPK